MAIYTDKILFVHIPKTAGASIIKKIKKTNTIHKVKNNRTVDDNYHSTANDCINTVPNISNLYKFTVVRNPWDRATSWFYFRKEILETEIKLITSGQKSKRVINNLELLNTELSIMNNGFNEWLSIYINSPWDYTWFSLSFDQHSWLDNINFDKIIKYENLNEDLRSVKFLDFSNLPYRHKSKNYITDYRQLYNTASIDLIQKVYKKDIEKFGYKFE